MTLPDPGGVLQVFLLAALYGFLGLLFVYLWKDERRAARGSSPPPRAHLVRLDPEAPAAFDLSPSNLLGRSADSLIRLADPLVSAHHARLSFAGGQWILEDLGSRNGTRVNDLPVAGPIALADGDVLVLGNTSLRFVMGPLPSSPEPNPPQA